MNPAMTPCTVPPGYYGGPYMPSLNPGQCGYPYPCTAVPGSYPVPFPGYGGPFSQPFYGPPQPYPSIPYAYGPYPGMFPPGYMVPQQAYPQPFMYGGPPMPTPSVQLLDGGAVQCPAMSINEIPDTQDQELLATLRPGDASTCASDLPAAVHQQHQQQPTFTAAVNQQQQMPTVTCKSPPGFPLIPSGDISPAGIQWNIMVSQDGLHVPGISTTPDIQDKDNSEGSSSELWPLSSEHSTAGCQTTPDAEYTINCQQLLDLTLDAPDLTVNTQPSRSDPSPEHSNKSVVNAQASSNLQDSSYQELVTDEKGTATSSLQDPIHDEKISEALNADPTMSVPATTVYHDTTGSDTTDGPTRSTWNAANKDFPFTNYNESLTAFNKRSFQPKHFTGFDQPHFEVPESDIGETSVKNNERDDLKASKDFTSISDKELLEPDYEDVKDTKEKDGNHRFKPSSDKVRKLDSIRQKDKKEPWDVFRIIERDEKRRDVHAHISFRIIKILAYVMLFGLMLTSLVTQKITLAIATSMVRSERTSVESTSGRGNTTLSSSKNKSEPAVHSFLLLIAMCTPYIFTFLSSAWRVWFGNIHKPSISSIIMITTVEVLHSIGLSLLVFHLLPNLGPIRGICILSATSIIPSILKPFYTVDANLFPRNNEQRKRILIFVLNLVAFFLHLSVLPFLLVSNTQYAFNGEISPIHINGEIPDVWNIDAETGLKYVFSLLLTSGLWWENFLDKINGSGKFKQFLLRIRCEIDKSRSYIYVYVSILKFIASVLCARLIVGESLNLFKVDFWAAFTKNQTLSDYSDILILIASGFVGYYVAYTSCKLHMQIFSFSFPCLLSTPVAVILMTVYCQSSSNHFPTLINFDKEACYHPIYSPWYHVTMASLWLLSLYWVGQHIWTPLQERLAKVERLFVNPLYCGILLEQNLILNRKRCHLQIIKRQKDAVDKEEENFTLQTPPFVYACATMWHENRLEMVQLLKSIFRMDEDQFLKEKEYEISNDIQYPHDYYKFEAHILFDDAFQKEDVNEYVYTFASVMNEAASSVHSHPIQLEKPVIISTYYGGQVIFRMPGENLLYIHLKDKTKIRHKKRWSQVMCMYYLLGYRKAENTFLLALDGDVDFTPGSVRVLLDRMKKDKKAGAACGRIHPIGNGPIVWYQKFEYAMAHWLQKATEHVLGSVLCSPGCFSLFRGSALMDDNVMKKYTLLPSEASQILMYDQGEDRWLCTLLLQQGYRVDYAAGADAYTYAPESFNEYFNQRKRWTPSTLANIMALLQDGKNTVEANPNISWLYIVYQVSLMVATLISPATILILIAGAFVAVFGLNLMMSYIASLLPAIAYFIICLTFRLNVQLAIAQILSGFYILLMMIVFVGMIITAVSESLYHPSVIFITGLVAIFVIAALLHPREWGNIIYGLLYYILLPSGFVLLFIYSLCNLNDISWGTRESGITKEKREKSKGLLYKIFSTFKKMKNNLFKPNPSEKAMLLKLLATMADIVRFRKDPVINNKENEHLEEIVTQATPLLDTHSQEQSKRSLEKLSMEKMSSDLPTWVNKGPFSGRYVQMMEKERQFWKSFVERYLKPLERNPTKENRVKEKLRELRNNVCGGMALINMLCIAVNFMLQLRSPAMITFKLPKNNDDDEDQNYEMKIEILGLLFIGFFLIILLVQFCGMVMHRWGTFLHLLAITELRNPFKRKLKTDLHSKILETYEIAKEENQEIQEIPEADRQEEENALLRQIEHLQETGTRYYSDSSSDGTTSSKPQRKSTDNKSINTRALFQQYGQNTLHRIKTNDDRTRYPRDERKRSLFSEVMNYNQRYSFRQIRWRDGKTSWSNQADEATREGERSTNLHLRGGLMQRKLSISLMKHQNEYDDEI
ncbi:chitin synthase chs-1-like [Saccostrea cucullata]|uniref:chitin synthase chs-1-like n=1 Tax=Saccostrea cuccullata TaxID=36930 RepID=UPI002ED5B6BA